MYHAESNPTKWARLYVGFDSRQFENINWDQASIGVRVRETKMGITDNSIANDTLDSISANDKVGLAGSIIRKMHELTT